MDDLISRQAALDIIDSELNGWLTDDERLHLEGVAIGIACLPRIDAMPVVRCKDCKHRENKKWDSPCPCVCADSWYSWMPEDDWFCANGERRKDDD